VYHIAFGVPMLILTVSEYLDELFQNGCLATVAFRGKLCRVVVVTVNLAAVLVVRILGTKHRRTDTAGKVLDVVFAVKRRDVGATERLTAFMA